MDEQTKRDIEMLLEVARPKIEAADQGGGPELFNAIGKEFGPVAHRVFLALDLPARTCDNYHSRAVKRVLLDPYTVLNRANSLKADGSAAIDAAEFWSHADMVKTLIDYLALKYLMPGEALFEKEMQTLIREGDRLFDEEMADMRVVDESFGKEISDMHFLGMKEVENAGT